MPSSSRPSTSNQPGTPLAQRRQLVANTASTATARDIHQAVDYFRALVAPDPVEPHRWQGHHATTLRLIASTSRVELSPAGHFLLVKARTSRGRRPLRWHVVHLHSGAHLPHLANPTLQEHRFYDPDRAGLDLSDAAVLDYVDALERARGVSGKSVDWDDTFAGVLDGLSGWRDPVLSTVRGSERPGSFNHWFTLVTPSDLARQARTVWSFRHVPPLSGLLSTLTGDPRIGLPPASPDRCDGREVESFIPLDCAILRGALTERFSWPVGNGCWPCLPLKLARTFRHLAHCHADECAPSGMAWPINIPHMSLASDDEIRSREELAAFVRDLHQDFLRREDEWENPNLGRFLEALSAWIDSSDGWYRNVGKELPPRGDWTFFARALAAAVVYE